MQGFVNNNPSYCLNNFAASTLTVAEHNREPSEGTEIMSSRPSISSPLSSSWTIADLEDEADASEGTNHSGPSVSRHSFSTGSARFNIRINPSVPCLEITPSNLSGEDPSSLMPSDEEFIDGLKERFLNTVEATKPKLITKYVQILNKASSRFRATSNPSSTADSTSSRPSPSSHHVDTQGETREPVQGTFFTDKDVSWQEALRYFSTRAQPGWEKMLRDITETKAKSHADDLNIKSRQEGRGSYKPSWDISIAGARDSRVGPKR